MVLVKSTPMSSDLMSMFFMSGNTPRKYEFETRVN